MAEKKYLLLADLPAQRERVEAVAFAFMRAAYLTDSVLFLLVDVKTESLECYLYLERSKPSVSVRIQLLVKNQFTPDQIIQQMDYYIVGNHPDEIFYVDAAIRHDVEIIGTCVAPDDIFSDLPVSAEVVQFRENLRAMVERELIEKFPPEQFEYFLFHEGLGESTAIFFLLKEYRKPRDKKILMLCYHPMREELMRACPYVDAVMKVNQVVFDYLTAYYADKYGMKKVFTAHSLPKILEMKKFLALEYGRQSATIPDIVFRDFLEISPSIEFKKYPVHIPETAVARANEIFYQLNLTKGKAIFIVTNGLYFGGLSHHNDFWLRLARRLSNEGYGVIFNGQDKFFSEFKSVFLSFFETVEFVKLCGNIVSIPTGFVEAVAAFSTVEPLELQCIFPNIHDVYYKRCGLMANVWNLHEILYSGSHCVEMHIKSYTKLLEKYLDANVAFSLYQWGNNAAEDDALIEKIVSKITSAG